MLWLSRPPWARWIGAGLIVVAALWLEMGPAPKIEHPFATADIGAGEVIDSDNTEMRPVPSGLFAPVDLGAPAGREIGAGDPVLASDVEATGPLVPKGWWVVSAELPRGVAVGDEVQVVLLDSGNAAPGIVVTAGSDDPFDTYGGAVAVAPGHASEVAAAAAEGRMAVLVSTG